VRNAWVSSVRAIIACAAPCTRMPINSEAQQLGQAACVDLAILVAFPHGGILSRTAHHQFRDVWLQKVIQPGGRGSFFERDLQVSPHREPRASRSLLHRTGLRSQRRTIAALPTRFAIPSEPECSAQSGKDWTTTGNPASNGEVSGAPRFAHGAFQRKLDLRLIAYAFIHDHYYGRTYTAATAIRRVSHSEHFNSLFPRGAYFTPAVVPFLGPQNLIDLHPVLQFQLRTNVTGAFAWDCYWRESTHDGIYALEAGY
jgi:hypothetical protein